MLAEQMPQQGQLLFTPIEDHHSRTRPSFWIFPISVEAGIPGFIIIVIV